MSKVNSAAATIERVARSLYEMVEDDDDSDGEIEFMPQPHSAGGLPRLPRLPHRRAANATRAARVVHRNNRSSNAAGIAVEGMPETMVSEGFKVQGLGFRV